MEEEITTRNRDSSLIVNLFKSITYLIKADRFFGPEDRAYKARTNSKIIQLQSFLGIVITRHIEPANIVYMIAVPSAVDDPNPEQRIFWEWWAIRFIHKNHKNSIRIKGIQYWINEGVSDGPDTGLCKILKPSYSKPVIVPNMTRLADIPEIFRDIRILEDNAVWGIIKEGEAYQFGDFITEGEKNKDV